MYDIVRELKPDVITIGYDQPFQEISLEQELETRGLKVRVVRMPHLDHDLDGTRKIIRKVIEFHAADKRLSEVERR
jgi:FAD synthetase